MYIPRHRWGGKDFFKKREREKGENDPVVIAKWKKEVHGGQDITAVMY